MGWCMSKVSWLTNLWSQWHWKDDFPIQPIGYWSLLKLAGHFAVLFTCNVLLLQILSPSMRKLPPLPQETSPEVTSCASRISRRAGHCLLHVHTTLAQVTTHLMVLVIPPQSGRSVNSSALSAVPHYSTHSTRDRQQLLNEPTEQFKATNTAHIIYGWWCNQLVK